MVGALYWGLDKLTVIAIKDKYIAPLATIANKNMKLAVTIQDGVAWISDDKRSVEVEFTLLQEDRQQYALTTGEE